MSRQHIIWLGIGVAVLAMVLFLFDPLTAGFFPPCAFHQLTGWSCPGCGTTRALHALLHGEPVRAFRLSPLFISALPLLLVLVVRRGPIRVRPAMMALLAVAVLIFGVLRNVTGLTP